MFIPMVPRTIPTKIRLPKMRTAATMSPDGAQMADSSDLTTESVSESFPVPTHIQAMMRLMANHLGEPHRSSFMILGSYGLISALSFELPVSFQLLHGLRAFFWPYPSSLMVFGTSDLPPALS